MLGIILKRGLRKERLIMNLPCFSPERRQGHGMDRLKELNGTEKTGKMHGRTERFMSFIVGIAGRSLRPRFPLERSSATSTARLGSGIIAESTTFKERALFVAQTLKRISIAKSRRAPRVVQISQCQERKDVYNITVERDHVFYANGILTCNCDSLEYLCLYIDVKEE
jgi:hypothetical protein